MVGFDVILLRFRANVNRTELPIPGLQRLFGIDQEAALKVVRSLPRAVRTSVSREVAERYAEALRSLGGEVEVRASRVDAAAAGSPPSADAPAAGFVPAVAPGDRAAVAATDPAPSDPAPPPGPVIGAGAGQPAFDTTAESAGFASPSEASGSEAARSVNVSMGANPTYPMGTLESPEQGRHIAELPTQPDAGEARDEAIRMLPGTPAASAASSTAVQVTAETRDEGQPAEMRPVLADSAGSERLPEVPGPLGTPESAGVPVVPESPSTSPASPLPPDPAKWESMDLGPSPQRAAPATEIPGLQRDDRARENASAGQPEGAAWPPQEKGDMEDLLSPVAWTGSEQSSQSRELSLDLEEVPEQAVSGSPRQGAEGWGELGDSERPRSEALARAVREDAGAGRGAVSKAPDPMRAAFISDEILPDAKRSGKESVAGDGELELAVQSMPRERSLTLSDPKPAELPAPLRALASRMGFVKPGMGDVLGGLWIVVMGLWVGSSTFLGNPSATDVVFDVAGVGWLGFGVYRLTTGSRRG